jgi:hypothetical protein
LKLPGHGKYSGAVTCYIVVYRSDANSGKAMFHGRDETSYLPTAGRYYLNVSGSEAGQ